MSRRRVTGYVLLGFIVICLSAFTVRVLSQAGQFTTIKTVRTGKCKAYAGVKAPEDIVIDRATRTAFFSSLNRKPARSDASIRGAIMAFDSSSVNAKGELALRNITPDMPKNFRPLGLSLFTGSDGVKRLFVVNHGDDMHQTIEIFDVGAKKLTYVKAVELGADFGFANDVLAVGPEAFYVSDSGNGGFLTRLWDFAAQRARSKIFYYDGKLVPAADGFVFANGLAISPNGEEVYALDTFARGLRFFKRDKDTGKLEDNGVLFIGTGVDNIDVAPDGSLWMAAHPRLIDFALSSAGWKAKSASQVLHAVRGKAEGGEMRTRYLDLGDEISGSSVAVAYGKHFIIGSALDDKFVLCSQK